MMNIGQVLKISVMGLIGAAMVQATRRRLNRMNLNGKIVLITGGSRGLGLALAKEFARRGALLALCGRSDKHLQKVEEALRRTGAEVFTHSADVTNIAQVEHLMQQVHARYGRIDILINNAGAMLVGPKDVMEVADYKKIMETNCWSSLYCTQAIAPYFKVAGVGHIVNITSIGGKIAVPHMLPYSVSKFAMMGLSQGLTAELAAERIKVTTVVPNLMRTGSPRNITVKGHHRKEYAWFKIADSLPFLSQSAANAAQQIVDGIAAEKVEITLTLTAKIAIALQALCPSIIAQTSGLANRLMPKSHNAVEKKGYESESMLSRNALTRTTDMAAQIYNQHE
ncbi:SDR family NAD(P)-dependent oxidoreductase [Sphingobacterium griseoflavum]|uniref:Ketoacyl reductase n=1 Tax=Sphingobacterium griseoflavum TaxID=1474952 RepID=A0ABQ3HUL3_9SPHI|nr:SDR family oxidoreductase [Sphingobacterium griseoflavum]GHE35964.1 ketoacyl reductase [Sphingobacterium griseoflavum]